MKRPPRMTVKLAASLSVLLASAALVSAGALEIRHQFRARDSYVADLLWILDKKDKQIEGFVSSILDCGNGGGMNITLTESTRIAVKCNIDHEWVNGKYYSGDTYRVSKMKEFLRKKR